MRQICGFPYLLEHFYALFPKSFLYLQHNYKIKIVLFPLVSQGIIHDLGFKKEMLKILSLQPSILWKLDLDIFRPFSWTSQVAQW